MPRGSPHHAAPPAQSQDLCLLSELGMETQWCQEAQTGDFPGGLVVKNPPANAGDMGSIPGPGRFHMLWGNEAPEPQLLSLCLEPGSHNY